MLEPSDLDELHVYIYMLFRPVYMQAPMAERSAAAGPLSCGHIMHGFIRTADGRICLSKRSKNDHRNTEDGICYVS